MGTPVSKEILIAYLTARHGDAEQQIDEDLAENKKLAPAGVLHWIADHFSEAAFAGGEESESMLAATLPVLEAIPGIGGKLSQYIRERQIQEMCETYQHLADNWNWTEGPASQLSRDRPKP